MGALLYIAFGFIWKLQDLTDTAGACSKEEGVQYYIYNVNVNVQVYHCVINSISINQCEDLGLSTVNVLNRDDIIKRCYLKLNNESSEILPCESKAKVNLLNNEIQFVTKEICPYKLGCCRYSVTSDKKIIAFWDDHYLCNKLTMIYNSKVDIWTPEERIFNKHFMSGLYDSDDVIALALVDSTSFCATDCWKTNINAVVASKTYLHGMPSDRSQLYQYKDQFHEVYNTINSYCKQGIENEDQNVENPTPMLKYEANTELAIFTDEKIAKMEKQLHYLVVVLIICIICIGIISVFNTYVNFLSLRKASRNRENNSKLFVLTCLSQSLMNRYLFFNKTPGIALEKLDEQVATANYEQVYVDI